MTQREYVRAPLTELLDTVEACLRNVRRLEPHEERPCGGAFGADFMLLAVYVPELVARLVAEVPGVAMELHVQRRLDGRSYWPAWQPDARTHLRRITTSLHEHEDRDSGLTRFWEQKHPGSRAATVASRDALRVVVLETQMLSVEDLVSRVRFALAGSRIAREYAADAPVYEPALTHHVVPALVTRAMQLC